MKGSTLKGWPFFYSYFAKLVELCRNYPSEDSSLINKGKKNLLSKFSSKQS